jgi:hypothetical protein
VSAQRSHRHVHEQPRDRSARLEQAITYYGFVAEADACAAVIESLLGRLPNPERIRSSPMRSTVPRRHRPSIGMPPSFDSTPLGSEKVSGPYMEKT